MPKQDNEEALTEYAVEEYEEDGEKQFRLVQRVVTPLEYDDSGDALAVLAEVLNEGFEMAFVENYPHKIGPLIQLLGQNGYEYVSHERAAEGTDLVFRRKSFAPKNERTATTLSEGTKPSRSFVSTAHHQIPDFHYPKPMQGWSPYNTTAVTWSVSNGSSFVS